MLRSSSLNLKSLKIRKCWFSYALEGDLQLKVRKSTYCKQVYQLSYLSPMGEPKEPLLSWVSVVHCIRTEKTTHQSIKCTPHQAYLWAHTVEPGNSRMFLKHILFTIVRFSSNRIGSSNQKYKSVFLDLSLFQEFLLSIQAVSITMIDCTFMSWKFDENKQGPSS